MAENPSPYDEDFDLEDAIRKAEAGDRDAKIALVCYMAISGLATKNADPQMQETYHRHLCDLVKAEYVPAYIMLADAVLDGIGCKQDAAEAIRWYEKAVENGEPFGNELLGEMYYLGKGVPVDYKKAFAYFTKDHSKKSFCTRYHLGEMYRQGLYVEKDLAKACEYYADVAFDELEERHRDDYYWRACYRLGVALHHGDGVDKDLERASLLLHYALGGAIHSNNQTEITPKDVDTELGKVNIERYFDWAHQEAVVIRECDCILNQQRYKDYINMKSESDNEYAKWHANYLEIIAQFIHNKMTTEEIYAAHDLLSDILIGAYPRINGNLIEPNDAGRFLMGQMSLLTTTSQLTQEEKRWFAFCICVYIYTKAQGREIGKPQPGITHFTSLARIKKYYEYDQEFSAAPYFQTADHFPKYDILQPLGYSLENPIITVSIHASYQYLSSLKSHQGVVSLNRECSMRGSFDEILDKWNVSINMPHNQFEKHILYVNPYGIENTRRAPDGFFLEEA